MKKHPTLGCCGLDCGLCPRFYTEGKSRCPGCCGKDFSEKHPSCSIVTCCVKKKALECCGECPDFICEKIKPWDSGDSFISHMVCLDNLKMIKKDGIDKFIALQNRRIKVLEKMVEKFDDGRSKNFFCIAATLLPLEDLEKAIILTEKSNTTNQKEILKSLLIDSAKQNGIDLKLRKISKK